MTSETEYTILLLLNAKPQWLSLSRNERNTYFEKTVRPVFQEVSQTVEVRLFDSEYFHARVSDFLIVRTRNLKDYQWLIERLRDTKIYSGPYFELVDLIMGQENGFREFDERLKTAPHESH
ncbi:darcynin family protein [Larkinella rosea]|uniref:DUF4286 family protein n=1 Tax=Larkinella rosea TaxID=2025312 RepID=A0A3P1B8Z1_9BACT|nr:darcynin family protein [Larkinella rosea]RRA97557.1 hypothetical protein EHT25_31380 [Larkinella rosea]